MKIAIACEENTLDSLVSLRFGRAPYIAFYDTESKSCEFILNQAKAKNEGAGIAAVNFILSHGARKIIAGEFGIKIKNLPVSEKIQMIIPDGNKTVGDIIRMIG